jgi:hypothetical protein
MLYGTQLVIFAGIGQIFGLFCWSRSGVASYAGKDSIIWSHGISPFDVLITYLYRK